MQLKYDQLHAASRSQQSKQRELSDKTLRSPFSVEFWNSLLRNSKKEKGMKIIQYFISSSGYRTHKQSRLQCPARPLGSKLF